MFEQSLLENVVRGGWKKALAVVISTTFQVFLLMVLVVMPLIFPEAGPQVAKAVIRYISLPDPPHPPSSYRPEHRVPVGGSTFRPPMDPPRIEMPTSIPDKIVMATDPEPPGDPYPVNFAPPGGGGNGNGPGGSFPILPPGPWKPPLPPPPPVIRDPRPEHKDPVRIGTLDPAKVVNHVQPHYPPLARQARIQGVVLLEAVISKTGRMERLHVISGHPLLVQAALDAVNQWRYMPTMLNGEPVEVITTIEVRFTLSQ
jgi:protein TonB